MVEKKQQERITLSVLKHNIAERTSHDEKLVSGFLDAFMENIIAALQNDGIVRLTELGTFSLLHIAAKEGVNIATGERTLVEAHNKVIFDAEKGVKSLLDNGQTVELAPAERPQKPKTITVVVPPKTTKKMDYTPITPVVPPIVEATPVTPTPEPQPVTNSEGNGDVVRKLDTQANEIVTILNELGQEVPANHVVVTPTTTTIPTPTPAPTPAPVPTSTPHKTVAPMVESAEKVYVNPMPTSVKCEAKDELLAEIRGVHSQLNALSAAQQEEKRHREAWEKEEREHRVSIVQVTQPTPAPTPEPTPAPAPVEQPITATNQNTPNMTDYDSTVDYSNQPPYVNPPIEEEEDEEEDEEPRRGLHPGVIALIVIIVFALFLLAAYFFMGDKIDRLLGRDVDTSDQIIADSDDLTDDEFEDEEETDEVTTTASYTTTPTTHSGYDIYHRTYTDFIASERLPYGSRLTHLSRKYYNGDKDFWVFIYEANKDRIQNPNVIDQGTLIRIPRLDPALRDKTNPELRKLLSELHRKYVVLE